MYIILWAVFVCLRVYSVSLFSVYYPYIIRIWNPELYALILCQFILVYFLDIFGIWSCTCIFFIPFKKARIFDFHLVSFDFSFGIIWFQLNQVNFTWLIVCNFFFKMLNWYHFKLYIFIYIFSFGIIYIYFFNWYHLHISFQFQLVSFLQYLLIFFFLYFNPFLTLSKGERNIGFWMIYCIICSFIYYSPKHILRGRNLRNFKIHQYMIEGEFYEQM